MGQVAVLFLSFTKFAVLAGSFKFFFIKILFSVSGAVSFNYNDWVLLFSVVVVAWHSR